MLRFLPAPGTDGLRSLLIAALTLLVAVSFSGPVCRAQVFTASLSGIIADPTGAAVPGATVTVRNTGTNDTRQTISGSDGRYTFSQLPPASYEVTVESRGFKRFVAPEVTLIASQAAEFNVSLSLGETSQTVEVAAAAPILDSQSADKNVTLSGQSVVALPTNLRNPLVLVWQTAGVVAVRTGIAQNVNEQNQNRFALNGGRDESSAILIDGMPSTAGDWGGALATPSIEAVQEVQVTRNSYDVQYGRTDGGVVSLVTKSGTSTFHGGVYDYLRNSKLDANTWDNDRAKVAKPAFQRNQFGAFIGGPIWNAKHLYVFGDYEGLRDSNPSTLLTTMPTALERTGNYSQTYNSNGSLSTIYNPFSTVQTSSGGIYMRTPFPGNIIPPSLLDPIGFKVANLLPLPNQPGTGPAAINNYSAGGKTVDINKRFDVRVDWAKSEHYSFFTRVTKAWEDTVAPTLIGHGLDNNYGGHNPRDQVVIGNTFVPNPTWVTNIIIGTGRWLEQQISPSTGLTATAIGYPSSLASQLGATTIPQFTIENYPQLSNARFLSDPRTTSNLQINNSKQVGDHSIKFGFIGEAEQVNSTDVDSALYTFNRGMTSGPVAATDSTTSGNGIASLLLGTGASGYAPNNARLAVTSKYFAGYIEDSWKFKRLTVNYGLRYEVQTPATERYNRLNSFNFGAASPLSQQTGLNLSGGLQFASNINRGLWNTDSKDWAPRLGIAYKITDKLVFRAGYGVFYAPAWAGAATADGFSLQTPWVSSQGGGGFVPQQLLSNPFPGGILPAPGSSQGLSTLTGLSVNAFSRLHPSPYSQTYSADFQYQISSSMVVEIGYDGVQGRKLFYGYSSPLNINQLPPQYLSLGNALNAQVPNPFYGIFTSGNLAGKTVPQYQLLLPYPQFTAVNLSQITPGASSSFNALTFKFSRRLATGLQAFVTYQWSKAIDNSSETQGWEIGDQERNVYNMSVERSISAHDLPQDFTASVIYDLPFGRGRQLLSQPNRVVNAVVGGWQLATTVRLGSGLPLAFTAPSSLNTYGYSVNRPDITSLGALASGPKSPDHWFNTSNSVVFAPPAYTIGTAPRWVPNVRFGALDNTDMSLMKSFNITERWKAVFQAQAFNVTNTPQYGKANTTVGNPNFGVITSSAPGATPRNVQLALRILF
jgi:Carboxypeptidase regulatory-like domain